MRPEPGPEHAHVQRPAKRRSWGAACYGHVCRLARSQVTVVDSGLSGSVRRTDGLRNNGRVAKKPGQVCPDTRDRSVPGIAT
jgi:hypothetical protein